MGKAVLLKRWSYGHAHFKADLDEDTWFSWIHFVNMIVDDPKLAVTIDTEWSADGEELFGWSEQRVDDEGHPDPGSHRILLFVEREIAMAKLETLDYRIETHQELIPIAVRVWRHLEYRQKVWEAQAKKIRDAIEVINDSL